MKGWKRLFRYFFITEVKMRIKPYSILFPYYDEISYKQLSDTTCHDLGMDFLLPEIAGKVDEQALIKDVLSHMSDDRRVADYRKDVFSDIMNNIGFRKRIMEVFDELEHIREFGLTHSNFDDEVTLWHLYQRLDELKDYIRCVEQIRECLSEADLHSEGLTGLLKYVDTLYNEAGFSKMKEDISALTVKASEIQSITVGVNVNNRLEATGLGLISVNSKPFKKSGIFSGFSDAISGGDRLQDEAEWSGDMHFYPSNKNGNDRFFQSLKKGSGIFNLQRTPFVDSRTRSTIVTGVMDDRGKNTSYYLEAEMNRMMSKLSRDLRAVLTAYADVAVVNISGLIPEFIYYIRAVEFIEKYRAAGYTFCTPEVTEDVTEAKGFYNIRLALSVDPKDMVENDIRFDRSNRIYVLTGANRGGKTTLTQAVGLLFLLAQGGIPVPAEHFCYVPADAIYTHFPADEDKTTDLGRLGEECIRFRKIYDEATAHSLILLNETFSTTSFEEGYFIAKDSIRAMLIKRVRMIYNTHMHKLGQDIDELNTETDGHGAVSMVMRTDGSKRSFRVELAPPEGLSFASDIAIKYGVTYDQMIEKSTRS